MSFFYSDLPDDAVFSGSGFLRSQQNPSLDYSVEVSWLVRQHLFTFRMPWVDFSDDNINLELQELRIQTPQGVLTADCVDGLLKSKTSIAITSTGELPLAEGFEPVDYDLPPDIPCEWVFIPGSSLLEFSQAQPNTSCHATRIKLAELDSELLQYLPKHLNFEDNQIVFHGTGFNTKSDYLYVEFPEELDKHFLDCFYLSLELLQGRAPKVVELAAQGWLEISEHRATSDANRFDLWTHHYSVSFIKDLLPQLLLKLHQLPEDVFAPLRTTIKLISFGKTAQAPIEIKFLTLISALTMLSNNKKDDLIDTVTGNLLGIQEPSAKLYRVLRNKLVHGGGSFHRSFPRIGLDEGNYPDIAKDLKVAITPSSCDFPRLWLRLCERISAHLWVSLLGSSQKAKHKCYNLPRMPLPSSSAGLLGFSA